MTRFLLRTAFHNRPGEDLLLAGRIFPAGATVAAGDWLILGKLKMLVQEAATDAYGGVILTVSQEGVETLRRAGTTLTALYGTEIPIESAPTPA